MYVCMYVCMYVYMIAEKVIIILVVRKYPFYSPKISKNDHRLTINRKNWRGQILGSEQNVSSKYAFTILTFAKFCNLRPLFYE
jgi:hypothetical protein